MADGYFDAPLFIREIVSTSINPAETPYFYNDGIGVTYTRELPAGVTPLVPAVSDPNVAIGAEHVVSDVLAVKQTPPYGVETQLGMLADRVVFEPMWVTRAIAAAFGITLVKPGEAIRIESPSNALAHIEYEYGVFAGHWSPYQNTGQTLLTVECTDLEHHDFPHIFVSSDPVFPLVVSVGRYWPQLNKIRLADLWVPRGNALYIPPKPDVPGAACLDLHNNRNSARACWGDIERGSIMTQTLLQPEDAFYYWFWNASPTIHTNLPKGTA